MFSRRTAVSGFDGEPSTVFFYSHVLPFAQLTQIRRLMERRASEGGDGMGNVGRGLMLEGENKDVSNTGNVRQRWNSRCVAAYRMKRYNSLFSLL